MEELLLTGLGIFLFNRLKRQTSPFEVGNIPPKDQNSNELDRRNIDLYEEKACPWYWYPWKRPAMFNSVPLSPGSSDRWNTACMYWREIRTLGREIKLLKAPIKGEDELFVPKGAQENRAAQRDALIKEKQNRQAFLLSETKRIAGVQKRTEDRYKQALANRFSEDEIKAFYQTRKDQIQNRIWPAQDTIVVPSFSPRPIDRAADVGPIDRGSGATQMASKYDRNQLNKNPEKYKQPWYKDDAKRIAAPPGKRVSNTGNVYYEYRINRSDQPGKNI